VSYAFFVVLIFFLWWYEIGVQNLQLPSGSGVFVALPQIMGANPNGHEK
jgi:hypothetical protein